MTNSILFSDLDQTMIYSHSSIIKHGQKIVGNICVEQLDDKPLSFLSLETWKLLKENVNKLFQFIPVTTRTPEQFNRVSFPDIVFEYAIVSNGAKILVNGEEDLEWTKKIETMISLLPITPIDLFNKIEDHLADHPEVKVIAQASKSFVYVVAHNQPEMEYITKYMTRLAEETGYQLSKQGRKIYLLPAALTKAAAVSELTNRLQATQVFSAGDTFLDYSMHEVSDLFLRPSHSEPFTAVEKHYTTEKHGVEASEDIIRTVLKHVN